MRVVFLFSLFCSPFLPGNKKLLRQFFKIKNYHSSLFLCHHIPRQNKALHHPYKPRLLSQNYCTYGRPRTVQHQSGSFGSCCSINCDLPKPSQFPNDRLSPMTNLQHIRRLVSSGILTRFPFHRLYLFLKLCSITDTLCEYLIFISITWSEEFCKDNLGLMYN